LQKLTAKSKQILDFSAAKAATENIEVQRKDFHLLPITASLHLVNKMNQVEATWRHYPISGFNHYGTQCLKVGFLVWTVEPGLSLIAETGVEPAIAVVMSHAWIPFHPSAI